MIVFDPTTSTFTRFTLAKGLLNEGYYEMARDEILKQITREFGGVSAEQVEQVKALPIAALEELDAALWELTTMADLKGFLAKLE
jgi:hypothetical protein